MNHSTKSVIGWIAVLIVFAIIVLGGNYLIFTYVGIWNYIALSILSGLIGGYLSYRNFKTHAASYITDVRWANNDSLIKHLKDEAYRVQKETKAFRD